MKSNHAVREKNVSLGEDNLVMFERLLGWNENRTRERMWGPGQPMAGYIQSFKSKEVLCRSAPQPF